MKAEQIKSIMLCRPMIVLTAATLVAGAVFSTTAYRSQQIDAERLQFHAQSADECGEQPSVLGGQEQGEDVSSRFNDYIAWFECIQMRKTRVDYESPKTDVGWVEIRSVRNGSRDVTAVFFTLLVTFLIARWIRVGRTR
jgi:hypothetical protein